MILAAGRGERLRPLTDRVPKPLIEIGGETLIARHLNALAATGVERVVVNLSWLGERIVAAVGGGSEFGLTVIYSDEGGQALETAGGIVEALPVLGDDPFWVVNGDVRSDFDFALPSLADDDLGHLFLVPNPAHHPGGDFVPGGGRLRYAPGAAGAQTFSGIALYRPALFAGTARGRAPLAPLLASAAADGRLAGSLLPAGWHDIGTPERLAACRKAVAQAS